MDKKTVQLNYLRIAPRKVRLVASSIRGLSVNEAEARLFMSPQRAATPILKLLKSAVANTKNTDKDVDAEKLFIEKIFVNQGPMMKRWMPRAQGRATPIQKKSSHITIVLGESQKVKPKRFKVVVGGERVKSKKVEHVHHEHEHEHERGVESEKAAAKKVIRSEKNKSGETWRPKAAKGPGFMRKMFRRKSI